MFGTQLLEIGEAAHVPQALDRIEIAAASPEARALGLTPGMALTQARAAVPDIDVRDADAAGDLELELRIVDQAGDHVVLARASGAGAVSAGVALSDWGAAAGGSSCAQSGAASNT